MRLRATNPIESTFTTVRLRTKVIEGSRAAGRAMAYKLIEAAETLWRAVNAPHLVVLVPRQEVPSGDVSTTKPAPDLRIRPPEQKQD